MADEKRARTWIEYFIDGKCCTQEEFYAAGGTLLLAAPTLHISGGEFHSNNTPGTVAYGYVNDTDHEEKP